MIPVSMTIGPLAAADDDLYVVSAIPTSGTAMTLTGASPAVARRALLTYGNELSARTLRLTGTNADGNPIRETLVVPSGGAGSVYTLQDYLTVTEAMPLGAGWTAAAKLGTNGIASSPWKITNSQHQAMTSITWYGEVSGTVTWGIQWSPSFPNNNSNQMGSAFGNYPDTIPALDLSILTAQTGSASGSLAMPFGAWRLVITSGTGSVTLRAIEGGMTESR